MEYNIYFCKVLIMSNWLGKVRKKDSVLNTTFIFKHMVSSFVLIFNLYSLNMQYVYATIGIFLLYTIAELNVYSK